MKFAYARHLASFCKANYKFPYSEIFTGANEYVLTDGLLGTTNYMDGHWQGVLKDGLDAIIELNETKTVNKISTRFLQNNSMGVFLPALVEYSLSEDGLKYCNPVVMWKEKAEDVNSILVKTISADVRSVKARFIRIHAVNIGVYPDWHPKKNEKAWLFANELIIE
jgi:hexosaminidase